MNNRTLRTAYEMLPTEGKTCLVLEGGKEVPFTELDFQDGGDNSDHVWLYKNRSRFACFDMRSVAGVIHYDE